MASVRASPRIAPLVVGVVLLASVVALSVLPSTGAVSAASNCQYGVCTNSGPSTTTWLVVLGVLLLIALALFVLILRGRPKRQAGAQAWEAGPSGGGDDAGAGAIPEGVAAGSMAAAPAATYVESPADVEAPEPPPGELPATAGVAAGATAGGEPDIDSLMAELDKISGEILSRGPTPKKPPTPADTEEPSS